MNRTHLIAEIANAHQGDPSTALELAKAAAKAGAESVKFQIYFADEFLTTTHPRYEHFKRQAFSKEEWAHLLTEAKALDVEVYADLFGLEAFHVASQYGIDGYKVHSSDLNNTRLLKALANQPKKVFLATGGSTILEIQYALETLLSGENGPCEVALLHGFQAYPTEIEDSVLNRLKALKELFGMRVRLGYSDHVDGGDTFSHILPLLALPYEIDYIEKHITFNRDAKGVDYYSSIEPSELEVFIRSLRLAEASLGEAPLGFSKSERHYRNTVKKSWVATENLAAGTCIEPHHIEMKRTPHFSAPPKFEEIVGQHLVRPLAFEEAVSQEHLSHKVLALIVARSNSSRLPAKATLPIGESSTLAHLFERVCLAKAQGYVDTIAFCTTHLSSDDTLAEIASAYPIDVYRGEVEDVLSRMMLAIDDHHDHDLILRITGDDILIDPEYLHKTVNYHLAHNAHYTDAKRLPSGTEVEVFSRTTLKLIEALSSDSSGSEYLTNYITHNADQFEIASLDVPECHDRKLRLTLDTPEDYEVLKALLAYCDEIGRPKTYTMDDIFAFYRAHPEVFEVNKPINQKAAPLSVNTTMRWDRVTTPPKITIYITNYNYGDYIKKAIESVLTQQCQDFEILIIDDGSTDHSKSIIEQYRHHPKITIIYQENKGLNVTNNIALRQAKGRYIMRLDADDYLHENALMLLAQKLDDHPELALVFPDYYLVDAQGEILAEEKRHDFENVTMFDQPAHGACTMIRREVLLEIGGYSEEFTRQDGYELWLKIQGRKVANISLPLFYYRQHPKSLTQNKEALYRTRHEIVAKHSDTSKEYHIGIIPIRDLGDEPLCLRPFGNGTLLDITLTQALDAGCFSHLYITTPNNTVLEYIKTHYADAPISADLRPEHLAQINTPLEHTVEHLLKRYEITCHTMTLINYEYPLRQGFYFQKAINTLRLFDANAVLSVVQESANFYHHHGQGLTPFSTNNDLRLERDFIYKETGGIHVICTRAFMQNSKILQERMSHILLDTKSAKAVESEEDFYYLQSLYQGI